MKIFIKSSFNLDTFNGLNLVGKNSTWKIQPKCLSDYNKIVLSKKFIHSIPDRENISYIYNLDSSHVGRIVDAYLPQWEKLGEYISILPILEEYFKMEIMAKYCDVGHNHVSSLVDGKDSMIETISNWNSLMR